MFSVKELAIGLVCLAVVASSAFAQTGPVGPVGSGNPGVPAVQSSTNDQALANYLRQLDPNTKVGQYKTNNGQPYSVYTLNIRRDNWNYQISVEVHPNSMVVYTNLGQINVNELPASTLVQLIDAQWKTSPTHFVFARSPNSVVLSLQRNLHRPISIERFGALLTEFLGDIRSTYSLWSPLVSTATPALPMPAANPAPAAPVNPFAAPTPPLGSNTPLTFGSVPAPQGFPTTSSPK
jgi:hypothetical protein